MGRERGWEEEKRGGGRRGGMEEREEEGEREKGVERRGARRGKGGGKGDRRRERIKEGEEEGKEKEGERRGGRRGGKGGGLCLCQFSGCSFCTRSFVGLETQRFGGSLASARWTMDHPFQGYGVFLVIAPPNKCTPHCS